MVRAKAFVLRGGSLQVKEEGPESLHEKCPSKLGLKINKYKK